MQIKNGFLILILFLVIGTRGFAQNTAVAAEANPPRVFTEKTSSFQVAIVQADTSNLVFRVFVNNPESKKITMSVLEKKNVINNQTISADYACSYNLNGLEDGDYSIVISDGKEKVTKNISIKTVFNVNRVVSFVSHIKEKSGVL